MVEFGNQITNIGYYFIPVSFVAYLIIRPLEYVWKKSYSKITKSIWYLSLGSGLLTSDHRVELIVMLLAFIESYDLFFQHFEDKRKLKAS